jgi:hypothetical protein
MRSQSSSFSSSEPRCALFDLTLLPTKAEIRTSDSHADTPRGPRRSS